LELWVFRHAQSTANRDQRMAGRSADPLTALGQAQAIALGQHLARITAPPTHLYCSPLPRAQQTLAGIQQAFAAPQSQLHSHSQRQSQASSQPQQQPWPCQIHDGLTEIDGGIFSGLTWTEVETQYPDVCAALSASADLVPVPGAESPAAIYQRAQTVYQRLLASHGPGDRVWVISHAGFLNYFLSLVLGSDRVWNFGILPSTYCHFQIASELWDAPGSEALNPTRWQIRRFNDSTHLLNLEP
jgi:broad specificity phosphatase PhoE